MSIRITIDGSEVEVAEGQTILDGARKLGIDVPTLCFLERCGPLTSCLTCIVKVKANGRSSVVPSCGMKAQPGMVIESETDELRDMRRTALELLLSDHVGDCLSPCHRICPLQLNVPVMMRHIQRDELEQAVDLVTDSMPMPSITGRLCNHPCESGCRRSVWDSPLAIHDIERMAGDAGLAGKAVPSRAEPTGRTVAIIGSGPVGLSVAWRLQRDGHACTVFDRHAEAGGSLRRKTDEATLPRKVLDTEIQRLAGMGIQFTLGKEIGTGIGLSSLGREFDAIVVAIGNSAKAQAAAFGIETSSTGMKINAETAQSSVETLFVAGSAVKPIPQLTRAMADGIAAARCVDQFLRASPIRRAGKTFSSIMGKVEKDEVGLFVEVLPSTEPAVAPADGTEPVESIDFAAEAARCLHCDCRAVDNCKLQHYAAMLGADVGRFRQQRRRFSIQRHPANVLFEPGKCILCGICVKIAKQSAEPLGLTFVGRGFDVKVGSPMNGVFAEGLQKVAAECVAACPTGAIVFADGKQQLPQPTACSGSCCGHGAPISVGASTGPASS